jgi:glutathione S-transferase
MGFKSRTLAEGRVDRAVKPSARYVSDSLVLVSHKLCPRVQRPVIALEEKGLPYNLEYIDLEDKPDWFLELSPLGRMPILRTEEGVLFNTSVITDYLDEITPNPLHPADPLERAFHRSWIEYLCNILLDEERLERAPDENEARLAVQVIEGKLAHAERRLGSETFFAGETFTLVDAAAAPLLQRLHWLSELAPHLGMFENLPRVSAWRDALLARDSVKASLVPDARERFEAWLRKASSRDEGLPSYIGEQTLPQEIEPPAERIYPDALS